MKKDIHPTYHQNVVITCSCGATFTAGSTREEITTELCSNCHPFYSGKQKVIDTAGRIEKFKQRLAQSGEIQRQRAEESASAKLKGLVPEAAVIDAAATAPAAQESETAPKTGKPAPREEKAAPKAAPKSIAKKAPAKKAAPVKSVKKPAAKKAAKAPAKKAAPKSAAKKPAAKKAASKKK